MFFWREKEVSYFVCMTEDSYCFDKVLNKQYYWSYLWLWIGEDLVLLNVCLSRKERKFFGRGGGGVRGRWGWSFNCVILSYIQLIFAVSCWLMKLFI